MPDTQEAYSAARFAARNGEVVTPSDVVDLTNTACLIIGGAGTLSVITAGGQTVSFPAVVAGQFIPLRVTRVRFTGTTATGIVAVW